MSSQQNKLPRNSIKRKNSSNPITSGKSVSNDNNEHEDENIIETEDDNDVIDLNFDDDELIVRLDILMVKAEWDLERSKYLLGKVEGYNKLCSKTVKQLKICRKSYVKVLNYSYQMSICNKDYEIDYASAIGNALSVDFTDVTAVTTATDDTTATAK